LMDGDVNEELWDVSNAAVSSSFIYKYVCAI